MNNKTIRLEAVNHNNQNRILIKFGFDEELIVLVKQLPDAAWSAADKAWCVPYTKENVNRIFVLFKGKAWIDYRSLKSEKTNGKPIGKKIAPKKVMCEAMNEEVVKKIDQFVKWLKSKRYSENTIKTYTDALKTFLRSTIICL
jgi:integrase/recombinase XerD